MNKVSLLKNKLLILSLSLFLLGGYSYSLVQDEKTLPFPITLFKLKNGLQVILSEDSSLPLVSVVVAYNVGSMYEEPGKTGLAYLLENLMFQGSENVSRMQHYSIIHNAGGKLNAATSADKTIFFQTVPSNQLARVLWLESDRMMSLEINDLNVQQIKDILIEEIHHRKATDPYLESYYRFDQLLYPDFFYSHPFIGNESDLRNITVEDVKKFYSTFYKPNNAVLSIAGNINKKKAEEEIRKYFETIPEGQNFPPVTSPKLPERKPIIRTHKDPSVPSPCFHLGYRMASPSTDDFYPLRIIEYILLHGKTSRLYKRLIKRYRTASHLSGSIEIRKNLARLKIFVVCGNTTMMERSKKAIISEVNRLKMSLISEKELQKSKNLFKMDYINQYATSADKARFLAESFLSKKSLDHLAHELKKYLAVTRGDITGIMRKYFTHESITLNIIK